MPESQGNWDRLYYGTRRSTREELAMENLQRLTEDLKKQKRVQEEEEPVLSKVQEEEYLRRCSKNADRALRDYQIAVNLLLREDCPNRSERLNEIHVARMAELRQREIKDRKNCSQWAPPKKIKIKKNVRSSKEEIKIKKNVKNSNLLQIVCLIQKNFPFFAKGYFKILDVLKHKF